MKHAESTETFIGRIHREVEEGYGFIPLLGAGISANSGILTTPEISQYICYCISRAVVDKNWSPRENSWPDLDEFFREARGRSQKDWFLQAILKADGPDYEALGALEDWRSGLLHLSRLQPRSKGRSAPSGDIIDRFFLHICAQSRPNIAHRMLAHLFEPLRFHTLLTTNFDELLEQAFADANHPLTVFPVHLNVSLPSAINVLAQPSLIKLHGGRFGLRADYSLDDQASAEDQREFRKYIGREQNPRHHLLVAGYSGDDFRTRSLIESAFKNYSSFQVFWVVYRPNEIAAIREHFSGVDGHGGPISNRLHILQTSQLGLFLLQLYQHLLGCIPSSGISWPAVWQLPMPRSARSPAQSDPRFEVYKPLYDKVEKCIDQAIKDNTNQLIVLSSAKAVTGMSSIAADVYAQFETAKAHFIWIDLDDCTNVGELASVLTEQIARSVGEAEHLPIVSGVSTELLIQQLDYYLRKTTMPFVVFFNARDGLGSNVVMTSSEWKKQEKKQFVGFLDALTKVSSARMHAVLLTYDKLFDLGGLPHQWCSLDKSCLAYSQADALQNALQYVRNLETVESGVARFLYTLTLFHHVRYPAALWSWIVPVSAGFREDKDVLRRNKVQEWLRGLANLKVVLLKQGGLVGIPRGLKQQLRDALEREFPFLPKIKTELHQSIADWYHKLFLSSDDPRTVFESVFHRIECAKAAEEYTPQDVRAQIEDSAMSAARASLKASSVREAINTLTLAKRVVLSRGQPLAMRLCLKNLRDQAEQLQPELKHEYLAQIGQLQLDASLEWAEFEQARDLIRKPDDSPPSPPSSDGAIADNSIDRMRLHISLRDYKRAVSLARKVCKFEGAEDIFKPHRMVGQGELRFAIPRARWKVRIWARDRSPSQLRSMIRCLRLLMHQRLLQSQAIYMRDPSRYATSPERDSLLISALLCYHASSEMMRFVAERNDGFLHMYGAYLRTLLGLVLANLGRFGEANRRFVEAQSFLSVGGHNRSALAVIALRQAEACLLRAATCWEDPGGWDARFSKCFGADGVQSSSCGIAMPHRGKPFGLLRDAVKSLEQAENFIRGQRRNVWWWTVYYIMCSKARELSLAVAGGHLEDSVIHTDQWLASGKTFHTELDIVREIKRLTRIDSFFVARVVESLVRQQWLCSLAEVSHRPGVEEKRKEGRKNLDEAIRDAMQLLTAVKKARTREPEPLDTNVASYVDSVEALAATAIGGTKSA